MNTPDRELNDDFENVPHVEDSAKYAMEYAEKFAEWLCKFGGVDAEPRMGVFNAFVAIDGQEYRINQSGDIYGDGGAITALHYVYQNYGDRLK
jgi:hypothetical protein